MTSSVRVYSYHNREYIGELRLLPGDFVTIIREIDAHYLEGEYRGQRGRFTRICLISDDELLRCTNDGDAHFELGMRAMWKTAQYDADSTDFVTRAGVRHFNQAEKLGNARAIAALGELYMEGRCKPFNERLAFDHFVRADEMGCDDGTFQLAMCYKQGLSVQQDEARAFIMFEALAQRGHLESIIAVANDCENGYGTAVDATKAFHYYKLLAEHELDLVGLWLCTVAEFFENGKGVSPNRAEAIKHYRLATRRHSKMGREHLERLGAVYVKL